MSTQNNPGKNNPWSLRPVTILTILVVAALAAWLCSVAINNALDSMAQNPTSSSQAPEPPVLALVAETFTLTSQENKPFTTASMGGKIWLVNFFFTSCAGPCPLMSAQIAGLLTSHPELNALSVTTDPETDTVPVLKSYGERFKADPGRWILARTDHQTLKRFGQDVLRLPVGEEPDAHSTRIVLIDAKHQIRGWYDSQDPKVRSMITDDIARLR